MIASAQRRTVADFVRERDFTPDWIADCIPVVLPEAWQVASVAMDGVKWRLAFDGRTVIMSGAVELDGKRWLHVSTAHPRRLPTWAEFAEVKDVFIGRERYAVQVMPPRSEHVSIHPNCLHWFSCVDGHPLPDFTRGGGTL